MLNPQVFSDKTSLRIYIVQFYQDPILYLNCKNNVHEDLILQIAQPADDFERRRQLACQIEITPQLDGLIVTVASTHD